jgi:serine/threonine-protein kinase HipA
MTGTATDIWVYAHWAGMAAPRCIGKLTAQQAKAKRVFGFAYDPTWLGSQPQQLLDPAIGWYTGRQFPPAGQDNFGLFLDSMPDTWGHTLMKRRALREARAGGKPAPALHETDFLLGVQDECRMGALRFKLDPDGPFLADHPDRPVPPLAQVRKL